MAAWVPIADLPEGGDTWQVCAYRGKVYLTLGYTVAHPNGYPWVLEYDPAANAYTQKAACPNPISYGQSAQLGGVFYLLGGNSGGNSTQALSYNIGSDTWSTLANMPFPSGDGVAVAAGGKVYNIGGYGASGATAKLQIYDVASNTWSAGADAPTNLSYSAAFVSGGNIFVLGGWTGSADSSAILRYAPSTNSWTTLSRTLPYGIEDAGFAMVGGLAYLISGYYAGIGTYVPHVQAWNIAGDTPGHDTDYPASLFGPAAAAIGTTLYVFGGWSSGPGEAVASYKLSTDPLPAWGGPPPPVFPAGNDFANPIILGSLTGTGVVNATTVGATWESQDPSIDASLIGNGRSINLRFPSPTPVGSVMRLEVSGEFTQGWGAELEFRNIPDNGSYSGSYGSSGALKAVGETVIFTHTADANQSFHLVVISAENDGAPFTVRYSIVSPQPPPVIDGVYTLSIPERRRLHGYYTKPTYATAEAPTAAPSGAASAGNGLRALIPRGGNNVMVVTTESYTPVAGGGTSSTLAVRNAAITASAITVSAPTLVEPFPPVPASGSSSSLIFAGVSVADRYGMAAILRSTSGSFTPTVAVVGFDGPSGTSAVSANLDWPSNQYGLQGDAICTRLSATKGLLFRNDDYGKVYLVDFSGGTPVATLVPWINVVLYPTAVVGDIGRANLLQCWRLTNTTALVYFDIQRNDSPNTVGPNEQNFAVLTVAGSSVSLGPYTTSPFTSGQSIGLDVYDQATSTSFATPTPTLVEIPYYDYPSNAHHVQPVTVAGGAVSFGSVYTPPDWRQGFGLNRIFHLGGGLGWARVRGVTTPNDVFVPISRFSQSGVAYPIKSPQQPDISIDPTRGIALGLDGDDGGDYSIPRPISNMDFYDPQIPVINLVVGGIAVWGRTPGYSNGSVYLNSVGLTPAVAPPITPQVSTIRAYRRSAVPALYAGNVMGVEHSRVDFPGSSDTARHLFYKDAHELRGGPWQVLSGSQDYSSSRGFPWRLIDDYPGFPTNQIIDSGVQIRPLSLPHSGTIGTQLRPGIYLVAPGEVVNVTCRLSSYSSGFPYPPPAGAAEIFQGRISVDFYNDSFALLSSVNGPWLDLPQADAVRPVRCRAVAPASSRMYGLTIEMQRAGGATFTSTALFNVDNVDLSIGGLDGLVDLGDGGLARSTGARAVRGLFVSGASTPGGRTRITRGGNADDAFGSDHNHEALLDDKGTVWAVVELGAADNYAYRIRQYSVLGTILRDFPAVTRPVALARAGDYILYVNGDYRLRGIRIATGVEDIIIDEAINESLNIRDHLIGICTLTDARGIGAGPGLAFLPPGAKVVLQCPYRLYFIDSTGVLFNRGISYNASNSIAGTLSRESARSVVYLERGADDSYPHNYHETDIGRMWTDGIDWFRDGSIVIYTPRSQPGVALLPALIGRANSGISDVTGRVW